MAIQNRAALLAQIATLLADNTTNNISELDMRVVTSDTIDSCFNTLSDSVSTALVANQAITHAKRQNVASGILTGRVSPLAGVIEELTPTQVRTLLGVAAGATADQNTYLNVNVPTQPLLTAAASTDTLTVIPGPGINMVSNPAGNSITISASASANNALLSTDTFIEGIDYSTLLGDNSVTLSTSPTSLDKLIVNFSGDLQTQDQLASLVGPVLTFTNPIPIGTTKIEVRKLDGGTVQPIRPVINIGFLPAIINPLDYTCNITVAGTVSLPAIPINGELHNIRHNVLLGNIIIDGNGHAINGLPTLTLAAQFDTVTLQFNLVTNEWMVI